MSGSGELPQSLLVVRLGAMGDVIHTMSAVEALRAMLPDIRIGWVIEERWAELLCAKGTACSGARTPSRPLIDTLHVVNTKAWRRSVLASNTRAQAKGTFSAIRSQTYDLAADFQGAIKSGLIARLAGAKDVIGFSHPRERPARFFYNKRVATHDIHVIEQYRSLAEVVVRRTLPSVGIEFPHDHQAEAALNIKLADSNGPVVVLNPGAGWAAKQWPAERYGEVARALAQDGLSPVINFGPGEEALASAAHAESAGTATMLSFSLGELIALLRRARLFIGGDTGPLHLAAALKVPVVAIFGPTDPARNGPYQTKSVVLRSPASRTSLSHASTPDPGLLQITAEEVVLAAKQALKESRA